MTTREPGNGTTTIDCESSLHEVLNTRDVARVMKCGVRKVQRLATCGQIPMKKFGGEFIITCKRLNEFLDAPAD